MARAVMGAPDECVTEVPMAGAEDPALGRCVRVAFVPVHRIDGYSANSGRPAPRD